jgi:hypothetical protein
MPACQPPFARITIFALLGQSRPAGSAQRPKKPESRDGCSSRMLSSQLQKSLTPDFEEKCGNSPDISKGISQLGICKFESSEVSQAVEAAREITPETGRKAHNWRALAI